MFVEWSDWEEKPFMDAMKEDFSQWQEEGSPGTMPDASDLDIIVAVYEQGSYDGSAIVIYRDKRDDKYYEVNASHCSCYGLEGQWKPEELDWKELMARPYYFYGESAVNFKIRDELVRYSGVMGLV